MKCLSRAVPSSFSSLCFVLCHHLIPQHSESLPEDHIHHSYSLHSHFNILCLGDNFSLIEEICSLIQWYKNHLCKFMPTEDQRSLAAVHRICCEQQREDCDELAAIVSKQLKLESLSSWLCPLYILPKINKSCFCWVAHCNGVILTCGHKGSEMFDPNCSLFAVYHKFITRPKGILIHMKEQSFQLLLLCVCILWLLQKQQYMRLMYTNGWTYLICTTESAV